VSDSADDRPTDDPLASVRDLRDATLRDLAGLGAKMSGGRHTAGTSYDPGYASRPPGRTPAERSRAVSRVALWALGFIAVCVVGATSFTYVNPGHVGIVIHRAGGGVDRTPFGPGLHFVNPLFTAVEEYPTFMQTLILAKSTTEGSSGNDEINVNSVEGQPLSLDVSMSFELDPNKVPQLYQTFRTDIATIQHSYVKQAIRQSLQEVIGTEPIADVIGPKKAEVVNRTQLGIEKRLLPYGIQVKQFTINELRAPPAVIDAINTKNVMQQQALTAQNELQKNQFQAQGDSIKAAGRAKAITAEAEAQARANTLLAQSLTPALVQYELAKKWNGQMPTVTGGATPLLQLPSPQKP
jgi:regulator of protease activity HflC (stomatin/prohibitin superfamily)